MLKNNFVGKLEAFVSWLLTNQKAMFFTDKTVTDKKVTFVYNGLNYKLKTKVQFKPFHTKK